GPASRSVPKNTWRTPNTEAWAVARPNAARGRCCERWSKQDWVAAPTACPPRHGRFPPSPSASSWAGGSAFAKTEDERFRSYGTLTPALCQRERELAGTLEGTLEG